MSVEGHLARFGLVLFEIDDLITVLEHADLYTHWYGPAVSAREKLDKLIADVKEVRDG